MKKIFLSHKFRLATVVILTVFAVALFIYLFFLNFYQGKMYPGIKISNLSVDGQTPDVVLQKFNQEFKFRQNNPIILTYQDQTFNLNLANPAPEINLDETVKSAYLVGRSGNYLNDIADQLQALLWGKNFTPKLTYNKFLLLTSQLTQINQLIKQDKVDAKLTLGKEITITPSKEGLELNDGLLLKQIESYLNLTSGPPSFLSTMVAKPIFATSDANKYKEVLEKIQASPLKLHFDKQEWTVDQKTLFSLLDFKKTDGLLDKNKLSAFLSDIGESIDQDAQDAKFSVDPPVSSGSAQLRVREFLPSQEGRKLDIDQTVTLINQALISDTKTDIALPVSITQPKVTMNNINNFGIKELLGRGLSRFVGSIENRIYNIGLASSRLNGTLLAPGDSFSFNKTVGEISGATGYKQAYVIKSGRTVLDDGGGVCQVSTTLFRAILNSGLPIIERTAHAYRVGYYEQGFPPGLDATVFAPTVDFKFKNDTLSYILIQAHISGLALIVDIYGTSDGRETILSTPIVTNQTPPPSELRQDDPTLPKGVVKQVDWSAWGANVSFTRVVKRGSETLISETFKSYFKPWQAVYLVGTKE